jgi:hypothetical protein
MNIDSRFDTLAAINLRRLQNAYPAWEITREGTRVKATKPGWGTLYGADAAELRERLERWTATYNIDVVP